MKFDRDAAVKSLAELVKCKTVSYYDHALEDDAEFEKLIGKLPELFPNVTAKCTLTRLPDRALLYRWEGKGKPRCEVMTQKSPVPAAYSCLLREVECDA